MTQHPSSIVDEVAAWRPIKLDIAGSALFVAKVQADALLTIAVPLIEELSKRPQTHWGEIIVALREKAQSLEPASLVSPPKAGAGEPWKPIDDKTMGPVLVCRFGDKGHDWLPMTAYRISGGKWERPASRDGLPYEPTHCMPLPVPLGAAPNHEARGDGVRVRPLRFEKQNIDGTVWASELGVCAGYVVKFTGTEWQAIQGMLIVARADTSEAAIAAAQADRASRIRKELLPPLGDGSAEITDAMVEAAAKAMCEAAGMNPNNWTGKSGQARAGLIAAMEAK